MRLRLLSLGIAGLVAASLFSSSAHANSSGIVGRSGKQGPTCMASGCHSAQASADVPTVELVGPTSLEAGTTGSYTLLIRGGPAVKAGMNVATSAGTLNAGADTKILSNQGMNELTHNNVPKNFDSATKEARFDFSLVAPATNGTVTLYASGNSTNGNANNTGDNAVTTTLSVQVTGGITGNPDAGTGNPDPGDGGRDEDKGCSATGGAPLVLMLLLAAAHLRRRSA
jgi:uncharacterized protein (TIGR03382 family)